MGTLPRLLARHHYPWTGPAANEAPLWVRRHVGRAGRKTKPQVLGAVKLGRSAYEFIRMNNDEASACGVPTHWQLQATHGIITC